MVSATMPVTSDNPLLGKYFSEVCVASTNEIMKGATATI